MLMYYYLCILYILYIYIFKNFVHRQKSNGLFKGGQRYVCGCEYMKHRVYSGVIINYCIFYTINWKPTFVHCCIETISFGGFFLGGWFLQNSILLLPCLW